jgi:hypothetical protein
MFKNYHIDGNKEMIAFGMMNIAGSFSSCYLTTGIYIYMNNESTLTNLPYIYIFPLYNDI